MQFTERLYSPSKTNMTMEKLIFEDLSPTKNGDLPASHVINFPRVYHPQKNPKGLFHGSEFEFQTPILHVGSQFPEQTNDLFFFEMALLREQLCLITPY